MIRRGQECKWSVLIHSLPSPCAQPGQPGQALLQGVMWLGGAGNNNLRVNRSPEDAKRPLQSWSQMSICAPGLSLGRGRRGVWDGGWLQEGGWGDPVEMMSSRFRNV